MVHLRTLLLLPDLRGALTAMLRTHIPQSQPLGVYRSSATGTTCFSIRVLRALTEGLSASKASQAAPLAMPPLVFTTCCTKSETAVIVGNEKQKQCYLQTQDTQHEFCLAEGNHKLELKVQPSPGRDNEVKENQAKNMAEICPRGSSLWS